MLLHDSDAVAALEANVCSMFGILGTGSGGHLLDTPTRLVYESPVPQAPYNAVFRFYDDGDRPIGLQVQELVARFASRPVTPCWLVHPTTPPAVRGHLEVAGWTCAETLSGMVASLSDVPAPPPVPENIDVIETAVEDAAIWLDLVTWRYGLAAESSPYLREIYDKAIKGHSRPWVASVDGTPVSKVVLHVCDGVAGIYGVATTEQGRGQGIASL
ncbi:MAG: GNAT family N-acetyltransferase, partial [Acidimicrobiales bacterium]